MTARHRKGTAGCQARIFRAVVTGIYAETVTAWAVYLDGPGHGVAGLLLPAGMTAGAVAVRASLRGAYGAGR